MCVCVYVCVCVCVCVCVSFKSLFSSLLTLTLYHFHFSSSKSFHPRYGTSNSAGLSKARAKPWWWENGEAAAKTRTASCKSTLLNGWSKIVFSPTSGGHLIPDRLTPTVRRKEDRRGFGLHDFYASEVHGNVFD